METVRLTLYYNSVTDEFVAVDSDGAYSTYDVFGFEDVLFEQNAYDAKTSGVLDSGELEELINAGFFRYENTVDVDASTWQKG